MKSLWISSGIVAALFLAACDSKETKARELGLTILDEAGFVTLLETGTAETAPEA